MSAANLPEGTRPPDALQAEVERLRAQRDAVLALHKPTYTIAGREYTNRVAIPWDELPADAGHICRAGEDACEPGDYHVVEACAECRQVIEEGEVGYLLHPCPTARALGVTE